MKRYGQWFSLLWVSATLAWSQAPVVSHVATDRAHLRWDYEQVQAPSLLNDFTLTNIKKTGDTAVETKGPVALLLQTCVIDRHAPVLLCCGRVTLAKTFSSESAALRLPLSCGPPEPA